MGQGAAPRAGRPELADQGALQADAVGHVEEGAAGKEGGVEGAELVPVGTQRREEVAFDQLRVTDRCLPEGTEDDPAALQLGGRAGGRRGPGPTLGEHPQRLGDGGRGRGTVGLLEGLEALQVEPLEIDLAPVRVPPRVGHGRALVDPEGLQPPGLQPGGLVAERAQPLHGVARETHRPR